MIPFFKSIPVIFCANKNMINHYGSGQCSREGKTKVNRKGKDACAIIIYIDAMCDQYTTWTMNRKYNHQNRTN